MDVPIDDLPVRPDSLIFTADTALRDLPYSDEEPMLTREELSAEHQRLRPYQGSIRVAAVVEQATSLADHPLESIGRLVIEVAAFGRWGWEQMWKREPLERVLSSAAVPRSGPRRCLLVV